MCPNMEWLYNFKKFHGGLVYMGHDKTCNIFEIGKTKLKLQDGVIRSLIEFLIHHLRELSLKHFNKGLGFGLRVKELRLQYVLNLKKNFISTSF